MTAFLYAIACTIAAISLNAMLKGATGLPVGLFVTSIGLALLCLLDILAILIKEK